MRNSGASPSISRKIATGSASQKSDKTVSEVISKLVKSEAVVILTYSVSSATERCWTSAFGKSPIRATSIIAAMVRNIAQAPNASLLKPLNRKKTLPKAKTCAENFSIKLSKPDLSQQFFKVFLFRQFQ